MMSLRKSFLLLGLLSWVNVAQAAIIELDGDRFSVSYDDTQTGLYKQGYVSGLLDTVYFLPNTLSVQSNGSLVTNPTQLQLTLTIDPGYVFSGLSFTERGDYYLLRSGDVDVAASVRLLNPDTADTAELILASGVLSQTRQTTPWELSGSLAPAALGASQTWLITLDNELFATAPTGGLGFIQKTYAGFQIATRPADVPEPSGLALLLAGGIAALLARRQASRRGACL